MVTFCKISEGAGSVEEGESEFAAAAQEGGECDGTNIAASRGNIGGGRKNFLQKNIYFTKKLQNKYLSRS